MSGLKQPAPLRSTLEEYDLVIIGSGAGAKFARLDFRSGRPTGRTCRAQIHGRILPEYCVSSQ